jgi:hypothetical protein
LALIIGLDRRLVVVPEVSLPGAKNEHISGSQHTSQTTKEKDKDSLEPT